MEIKIKAKRIGLKGDRAVRKGYFEQVTSDGTLEAQEEAIMGIPWQCSG